MQDNKKTSLMKRTSLTFTVIGGISILVAVVVLLTVYLGEDNDDKGKVNNLPPVAFAGLEKHVEEGQTVILDAKDSSDPDGDTLRYSWRQIISSDDVQVVNLDNSGTEAASFIAPQIGSSRNTITLQFELMVFDSHGKSDSDIVNVVVENAVIPPTARAIVEKSIVDEPDHTVIPEDTMVSTILLDGSQSNDSDGTISSYLWEQVKGSPSVVLKGKNSQSASFDVPSVAETTVLTFQLTVTDNDGAINSDTIGITIKNINHPPTAEAGIDVTAEEQDEVALIGTASLDIDGDILTYSWVQTSGPQVVLSSPHSSTLFFKVPEISGTAERTLVFQLTVNDGEYSATDNVEIKVVDQEATTVLLNTHSYTDSVANHIKTAEQFVYISTFYADAYGNNKIINELEAAKNRGVEVRLMFDEHSFEIHPTVKEDLEERGIPYKIVSNHAKIVVIDNKTAYVGSANLNQNGLELNWELSLKTTRASTISEAYQYLEALWERNEKPVVYPDDANRLVEQFVNGPEFYSMMLEELKQAQESVKILMYEMTYDYGSSAADDSVVLNQLKKTNDRGLELRIVLDDSRYNVASNAPKKFLVDNDIPHRVDEKYEEDETMHAKAVLIDERILFIGSHNWNKDSLDSSQEASIMTTDPGIISDFLQIFNSKWQKSSSP